MNLSVVIPILNAEDHLAAQLRALASQDYTSAWELVLVDNGSTDGTRQIIELHRSEFESLTLVDGSDAAGQAHALNRGVREAANDSILLLDSDDEVAPGYLREMAHALSDHEFVASRLDCRSLNAPWVQASRPSSQEDGIGVFLGFLPAVAGCSIGFQRAAFDRIKGFDETLGAGNDIDFCWRHQLAGGQIEFVAAAVLRYRYRSDLRGIFQQARGYGASGPRLYKRFRRAGMSRRSPRSAASFWLGPARRVFGARSRSDVASLFFMAGFRVGTLDGCFQERVVYL